MEEVKVNAIYSRCLALINITLNRLRKKSISSHYAISFQSNKTLSNEQIFCFDFDNIYSILHTLLVQVCLHLYLKIRCTAHSGLVCKLDSKSLLQCFGICLRKTEHLIWTKYGLNTVSLKQLTSPTYNQNDLINKVLN